MKSSPLLALCAIALACGTLVLLLGRGPESRPASARRVAGEPGEATPDGVRAPEERPGGLQPARDEARTSVAPAPEPPRLVEVGFDPTAVYGRVVDESGSSVADALVTLLDASVPREGWTAPLDVQSTDAHGRLRFEDRIAFRPVQVQIEAEGFALFFDGHRPGTEREFELERESVLEGRVVEDFGRAGVPGVLVTTRRDHWDGAVFSDRLAATTDASGAFRISGLPAGATVKVGLRRPGGLPLWRSLSLEDGPLTTWEIALGTGPRVVGRVLHAYEETPLAGVEVLVKYEPIAVTDEDGEFVIEVVPGANASPRVTARAPGFLTSVFRGDLSKHVAAGTRLEMRLIPGAAVTGRVVDSAGEPIPDAHVTATSPNSALSQTSRFELRHRAGDESRGVFTDENGHFRLGPLVPGVKLIQVSASRPGLGKTSTSVTLAAPNDHVEVELVMGATGSVRGRVLAGDVPVPATVRCRLGKQSRKTDANDAGEFRIDGLPPGLATLVAEAPGFFKARSRTEPSDTVTVRIVPGETVERDILLASAAGRVAGTVVYTDGTPASGLRITASRPTPTGKTLGTGSTQTDASGRYELDLVGGAGLPVLITASNGRVQAEAPDVIPPRDDVDLVLRQVATLGLSVTDLVTGEDVLYFQLRWREDGEGNWQRYGEKLVPGGDGRYELVLPVGVHDFWVRSRARGYVDVEHTRVPVRSAGSSVEVRLERGTKLTVTGKGDVAPLGKSRVFLVEDSRVGPLSGDPVSPRGYAGTPRAHPLTFQGGVASAPGIAPGRYRILIDPAKGKRVSVAPEVLVVEPRDAQEVSVRFDFTDDAPESP